MLYRFHWEDYFPPPQTSLPFENRSLSTPRIETNDDQSLTCEFMVPGYGKEDLELSCHKRTLIVRGKKTDGHALCLSTTVPKGHDLDKISASCKNGILTVNIPMKEPSKEERRIIKIG